MTIEAPLPEPPATARPAPAGATAAAVRCPCCGHAIAAKGAACARCDGTACTLADAPEPLQSGRGIWPLDLARGFTVMARAVGQVMHHRCFVGLLKVPVLANAVAFGTFAAVALLVLLPAFVDWFASSWPVLDGFREAHEDGGPVRMLMATVLFLWPVWFDALTGPMLDPLIAAAERAVGGKGMAAGGGRPASLRTTIERLRYRARMFLLQLAALPLAWVLILIPWVGLPLVLLASSAFAAAIWCETPAARRGLPLRRHLQDLRHNWARALGFGLACQVAIAVPFVNLLVLGPAAAVGATVLHFQFDKDAA